jgi:adenylate cyclase
LDIITRLEGPTERRLAAILAADVFGYSRLVGADEEGTLLTLSAYRKVIDELVRTHHGRVFGSAGDSVIAEFASPVEAVRCAVEIQHECGRRNVDLPQGRRMEFRIGVNLGDVVVEGDNLLGNGVNVAARLEELADPGGIYVSDDIHRHVEGKLDLGFVDIGTKHLKNIAKPVRVYQVQIDAGGSGAQMVRAEVLPHSDQPAIAVLPFNNMSTDPEQEYFSDGLTEDIITALTHWRSFPVIARNSCFAFKNKSVDIKQAGRELGARYLLEGSVRKGGARVRITAQLIDGANGHHIWAERYDRELTDIFEVQDEIVQRIAALVAPELARAEVERSTKKQPQDLEAWDLCLRGTASIHERTAAGNAKARDLFTRAIAIRPDYADAYSGIAMSFNQDILIEAAEDRTATAAQAMETARKAIECDEASSWAHHELSTAYQWLNRFDDALAEARISVELNPNDAYGLHALGNKSDLSGDPNGIAFMERAQKLNPADARLHTHLTFLARAYASLGDQSTAVERARQAIRRRPGYAPAHYILAIALGHLGELDEARAALAKCDELSPGFVQSRRDWQPYADPASNERLHEGLRRIEG